jgi:IS5 family transposase
MADQLDWTGLEEIVQRVRDRKLKNRAGRPPHLRALIGAVVLMAQQKMTYRQAEDQIRHHAAARYLCGLTESQWSPDFTTIQDFTKLMGEEGLRLINEYVVQVAVDCKVADPSLAVADMTAQEAAIPYPNEMGLMATFLTAVVAASKKGSAALKEFAEAVAGKVEQAKKKLREYRLFAKDKSKAAKDKMMAAVADIVESVQSHLATAIEKAQGKGERLRKLGKMAGKRVKALHETMKKLLPQIRYWLRTGRVAAGKIINLRIPELYAIVRGKVGKAVEFGLSWGITRIGGGFVLATVAKNRGDLVDSKFAIQAVEHHRELFGSPPKAYAYDRGGYSAENVAELRRMGVQQIGLAPRGKGRWEVTGKVKEKLVRERALVEGCIGSIKSQRYGFNRPGARSEEMMGACGQRAVLGFNLNKLQRALAGREA